MTPTKKSRARKATTSSSNAPRYGAAASKRAESAPAPAPALQRDKKGTLKRGSQARQKNA